MQDSVQPADIRGVYTVLLHFATLIGSARVFIEEIGPEALLFAAVKADWSTARGISFCNRPIPAARMALGWYKD